MMIRLPLYELPRTPARYDFRSRYAELFGGRDGYIFSKEQVLAEIKTFMEEQGR